MTGRGTNILAADYNAIQSKVATVLGTGTGKYGYGQTVTSSQAVATQTITAQQWLRLRTDLIKSRQHQTGTDLSDGLPFADVTLPLTEESRALYNQMANTIYEDVNRLAAPPLSQATLENLIPIQQRTTWWNGVLTQTITVTFASADAARFFFNAGSRIQFSATRTGFSGPYQYASSGTKNATWSAIFDSMGTVYFNHDATACTGTGNNSSIGFYELTTSNQLVFAKYAPAGPYAANKYYIYARIDETSSIVTFTIEFHDDAVGNVDEPVDGTLQSICQVYRASGVNVTVPAPTATTSGLPGGQVFIPTPPPAVPIYNITPSIISISENSTITYTIQTTNVSSGTTLFWTVSGTISAADITGGIVSGSVTISNNAATFDLEILADQLTESTENLYVRLRTGSVTGPVVATSLTTTVYDTSLTPPAPLPVGEVVFDTGWSTQSWTVPSEVYLVNATVVAGGGAGGSSRREDYQIGGGGGGAGGHRGGVISVVPGEVLTIKVGGGAAGSSGGISGIYKNGATLMEATGGSKGEDAYANAGRGGFGGAGGSPNGDPGLPGEYVSNTEDAGHGVGIAAGGMGGGGAQAGGLGGGNWSDPTGGYNGQDAKLAGGGGGGAGANEVVGSTVQAPYAGGAGKAGYVRIVWGS